MMPDIWCIDIGNINIVEVAINGIYIKCELNDAIASISVTNQRIVIDGCLLEVSWLVEFSESESH